MEQDVSSTPKETRPTDIGVVTIKKEEYEAVLDQFPDYEIDSVNGTMYAFSTIKDSQERPMSIAVSRTLDQGNVPAYEATSLLIQDTAPRLILLVGIGGGFPSNDFTLGDVVLASRLVDFCVRAEDDGKSEWAARGGYMHPMIESFLKAFYGIQRKDPGWVSGVRLAYPYLDRSTVEFYGDDAWQKKVKNAIAHHFDDMPKGSPKAIIGPVATSDVLVKDAGLAAAWRESARDIHAVEMELAGAHRAAYRRSVPLLAIRGVSDIVGLKRKESWVPFASNAAAAMMRWIIQDGHLMQLIPPRPEVQVARSPTLTSKLFHRKVVIKISLISQPRAMYTAPSLDSGLSFVETCHQLKTQLKLLFPDAEDEFPTGSLHSPSAGEFLVLVDKPTVALRSSIEFLKSWASRVPTLPDCNVAIDYGDVHAEDWSRSLALEGSPISTVVNLASALQSGQIAVTETIKNRSDSTLVTFRAAGTIPSGPQEERYYFVIYEDPRILQDTGLAHAIFIADQSAQAPRNKTIQALAIAKLLEHELDLVTYETLRDWLADAGFPRIAAATLREILQGSHYLAEERSDNRVGITIRPEARIKLETYRSEYEDAKRAAISEVRDTLAGVLAIPEATLTDAVRFDELVEEYLCAVFLEIRMMANYFKSTNSLFDGLSISSEFDYVLKKHLPALSNNLQQFAVFKKSFLQVLHKLAAREDAYLAAVFHNVLMLYYLNRNEKLVQGELQKLRDKQIYLDNNAFYSYLCQASNFHEFVFLVVSRLTAIGAAVKIFDCSLAEYHQSLDSTMDKVRKNERGVLRDWRGRHQPWIWQEFQSRPSKYANEFEICVLKHKIEASVSDADPKAFEKRRAALKEKERGGIELEKLDPFKTREELGDVYAYVHTAKDSDDRAVNDAPALSAQDYFHDKVLHDANCIAALDSGACGNPHSFQKIFLTCDFKLARGIHRKAGGRYDFVVTAREFYEFMMPYLFIGEGRAGGTETPRVLLSSMLSREIFRAVDLKAIVGDVLLNSREVDDFRALVDIKNSKRFDHLSNAFHSNKPQDPAAQTIFAERISAEYELETGQLAGSAITARQIDVLRQQKSDLIVENEQLRSRLADLEKKEKERKDYVRRYKKRKNL